MSVATSMTEPAEPLIQAQGLVKHYPVRRGLFGSTKGLVRAVDGVDLDIAPEETVGLVGESGCGKSTLGRLILSLERPTAGRVLFQGRDMAALSKAEMKSLRREVQVVFQDPYSSLNPRFTVGQILAEPLVIHGIGSRAEQKAEVQRVMDEVGLRPEQADRFPHEFSGGQRQRIGIARALILKPKLIVADEPISALDVSIQAQVINLLDQLQEAYGLTYLFIAHDLSVVRHVSDRIAVMYLGKVVEVSPTAGFASPPLHPYTEALLSAAPATKPGLAKRRIVLQGDPPSPLNPPPGCRFHTRCPLAQSICRTEEPKLIDLGSGQFMACHVRTK